MDEDDNKKAEELLKKRRLAAKGLKERGDGKPVDPLEDIDSLGPDDKDPTLDEPEERQQVVAQRAAIAGIALGRNG